MPSTRVTIQRPLEGAPPRLLDEPKVDYRGERPLPPQSQSPTLRYVPDQLGLAAIQIPAATDTSYLSHGYIRYIGKYPPQLVSYVLNKYEVGGPIVDPMCGGGTTLAEAHVRGLPATGIDVNPVARLAAATVAKPLDPGQLEAAARNWLSDLAQALATAPPSKATIDWRLVDHYFTADAKRDVEAFMLALRQQPVEFHSAFLTSLFNVLRRISFANIKKMNLEIDESRTNPPRLAEVYPEQLLDLVKRNRQFAAYGSGAPVQILEGEAENTGLADGSAAAVFLHPPYMTNTAFSEFSQLQLALLGISHKEIWKKELRCRGSFLHEPNGVRKYLVGWAKIINEAARVVEPGGIVTAVVGDGQIDYVRIPVGTITAEFAQDAGLVIEERFFNVYANHTGQTQSRKMVGQHLLVMRRPS